MADLYTDSSGGFLLLDNHIAAYIVRACFEGDATANASAFAEALERTAGDV